ncbi:MAG TPA: PhnD/SsuA/transferrin family substrate-binding protein [Acidimicrobiales bacterium]|nr:PhnD/SsuA/transferrin family substrate-binding protein [Acidimicrobiales bacterium]
MTPFVLGAVAYDPKVVTIWEGFKDWFTGQGFAFDYVLFSNYEAQAEAHLAGHVDVTWDSPLAWVRTRRLAEAAGRTARAVAMRDSDQDLRSSILVRDAGGITAPAQLAARTVATGASDSPQATLLPLAHLAGLGLAPGDDFTVRRFDVMVGKHGDHVGGERDAVKALVAGEVDAACVIDGNDLLFAREGTVEAGAVRVLARTATYDHCTMTVLDDAPEATVDRFVALLSAMSYDDPAVRPLLQLEGLKEWRPGRTSGYDLLEAAVDTFGFYGADGTLPG